MVEKEKGLNSEENKKEDTFRKDLCLDNSEQVPVFENVVSNGNASLGSRSFLCN